MAVTMAITSMDTPWIKCAGVPTGAKMFVGLPEATAWVRSGSLSHTEQTDMSHLDGIRPPRYGTAKPHLQILSWAVTPTNFATNSIHRYAHAGGAHCRQEYRYQLLRSGWTATLLIV